MAELVEKRGDLAALDHKQDFRELRRKTIAALKTQRFQRPQAEDSVLFEGVEWTGYQMKWARGQGSRALL